MQVPKIFVLTIPVHGQHTKFITNYDKDESCGRAKPNLLTIQINKQSPELSIRTIPVDRQSAR